MSQPDPFSPHSSANPSQNYGSTNPNQTPLILAICSLGVAVVGLLSCGCCFFLPLPVVSLVLGGVALNSQPDQNARLMAIIGMSIAGLTLVIVIMVTVIQFALGVSAPRFPQ